MTCLAQAVLPNFEYIWGQWYRYPLALSLAYAIAFVLVPVVIWLAPRMGMIDLPDPRRVHKVPTPRGGGIAVWVAFHGSLAVIFALGLGRMDELGFDWWLGFLAASGVLLVIGVLDDSRGMSPLVKLAGQALAAAVLITLTGSTLQALFGIQLPVWLDLMLTMAWYLALINAFNLIDGLDGLCSGVAVIGAIGLGASYIILRNSGDFLVPLALVGACLAFLRYNFHPAKIFLGDTGSMFLGFALAAFALETTTKSTFAVSIGMAVLAAGVPLFDTILAIWRRSVRKVLAGGDAGNVMGADKDHLHHRLLASGMSTRRTALALYAGAAALVALGLLSIVFTRQALGIYLVGFVAVIYVIVRHVAHIELWDTSVAVTRGLSQRGQHHFSALWYAFYDLVAMSLALGLSLYLIPDEAFEQTMGTRELWLRALPFWVVPMFLSLFFSRSYDRVWSRAGAVDFLILQAAVVVGTILSLSLAIFAGDQSSHLIPRALLFGSFCFGSILLARSGSQIFRVVLSSLVNFGKRHSSHWRNVLIYGASERSLLLLREIEDHHVMGPGELRVVGFLDDDPSLRKRLVKGHQVFGGFADLPKALVDHAVEEVIVCCDLSPTILTELAALTSESGVALSEWSAQRRALDASVLLASGAADSLGAETVSVG